MLWRKFSCVARLVTLNLKRSSAAWLRPLIAGQEQKLLYACTRNQKYMRGLIAPKVEMKYMPQLRFRTDTALDYASKIDALLRTPEVKRDLETE